MHNLGICTAMAISNVSPDFPYVGEFIPEWPVHLSVSQPGDYSVTSSIIASLWLFERRGSSMGYLAYCSIVRVASAGIHIQA